MALIGQAVSEKKIFENGGRRRRTTDDDGRRTPDHGHPISSPCEPNGSGELKSVDFCVKKDGIIKMMLCHSLDVTYSVAQRCLPAS